MKQENGLMTIEALFSTTILLLSIGAATSLLSKANLSLHLSQTFLQRENLDELTNCSIQSTPQVGRLITCAMNQKQIYFVVD
jgi:hypothetical protein